MKKRTEKMQENTKTTGKIPTRQVRSKVVMGAEGEGACTVCTMIVNIFFFFFILAARKGKTVSFLAKRVEMVADMVFFF